MIADALRRVGQPATHIELQSIAGHDAFLIDYEDQVLFVRDFLDSLS
jgi:homoserine O-acetyltransferase